MKDKPIYRQLLALALPLVGSNLLQQTYSTVNAIFVGRYVGFRALAAIGASYYIVLILTYFFIGLSVGASIVVAQAYGAGDEQRVFQAVHTTIALSLLSGVLLTAVGIAFSSQFLRWMNVPEDVLNDAVTYLRVYFCGMIPMFLYNMGSGILRAIGDTKATLYSLVVSCLVNIALDYLFIAVWHTGVTGAAWATVLSQILAALVILLRLVRTNDMYRFQPCKLHVDREQLIAIVSIGAPAGIQSVLQCFSNVYFQSKINLFGSDLMAGSTAFSRIDGFLYMPIEGFALAASSLVGQCIGAKQYSAVKQIFRSAAILCIGVTALLSGMLVLSAPHILGILTPDNEKALFYGVKMLRFIEPLYFIYGMNQIFGGVIRGTGQSRAPMLIILTFTCGFRVVWSTLLGHDLDLLLFSYPLSWMLTWAVYCLYYFRGNWLKKHMAVNYIECT